MAVDHSFARWQIIHDVTKKRRTGCLIAQQGQNYVYWLCGNGELCFVSSTFPESSFGSFITGIGKINAQQVVEAEAQIDEQHSLGHVLVQRRSLTLRELEHLLRSHWQSFLPVLFDPATHLFWSDRSLEIKKYSMKYRCLFSQLLSSVDPGCIEVIPVLRFLEHFPGPYLLTHVPENLKINGAGERRILQQLRTKTSLSRLLQDPELDRMTCYRTLFLLWLCGCLHEPRQSKAPKLIPKKHFLLSKVKSIPADWYFPLVVGMLLGAVLVPAPPRSEKTAQPKVERLKEVFEKPAWRLPEENRQDAVDK